MKVDIDNSEKFLIIEVDSRKSAESLEKNEKFRKLTSQKRSSEVFLIPVDQLYSLNDMLLNSLDIQSTTTSAFKKWVKYQNIKKPVIIHVGVVNSKIVPNGNPIPHTKIEKVTRFFVEGAVHSQAYKSGHWDGYINLYQKRSYTFKTGLIERVIKVLEKEGMKVSLVFRYERVPEKQFSWKVNPPFELTEDQWEAIDSAVKGRRGVIKCPTGFGKTSAVAAGVVAAHGVPTLFIANRKTLLDDAKEDFLSSIEGLEEDDVTQIKDGWFGELKVGSDTTADDVAYFKEGIHTKKIVVATVQSIKSRLDDPRTKSIMRDWLRNYCKCVVIDETQAVGSTIWDEVLGECQAPYRIAMSATPKRTDGATIKIEAYSGPWLYSTTACEQIEKGRLCELDIVYKIYDHKLFNEDDSGLEYHEMYQSCIVDNEIRNVDYIVKPTLELLKEDRIVLVLIQHIEHGHILKNLFLDHGVDPDRIDFIWGDTPDKIRLEAIDKFRNGKTDIMIGSTIFDVGLNVPVISGVVMAGAGKSEITLIQRIGRGARMTDYSKIPGQVPKFIQRNNGVKVTKVIDVYDVNAKFFRKQSYSRYKNARDEFGKERVRFEGDTGLLKKQRKAKDKKAEKKLDQMAAQLEMLAAFVD